jgi:hypothetical protein
MGAVMVKCPETGRDIPTGIVTDRESFNATPVFFARVYCSRPCELRQTKILEYLHTPLANLEVIRRNAQRAHQGLLNRL